jgi:hypothetical protein
MNGKKRTNLHLIRVVADLLATVGIMWYITHPTQAEEFITELPNRLRYWWRRSTVQTYVDIQTLPEREE